MKHIFSFAGLAMAALSLLSGCATSRKDLALDGQPTVTCHVCRYNNDLACVCVKLKDTTPRAEFGGTTYYFCSDDCRAAFLKNPGKYAQKLTP